MMDELVKKQDVIDAAHYYIESGYKCDIFQELKNLPSIEPERTAKATCNPQAFFYHCECGYALCCEKNDMNYCPYCGAKLEWE